MRAERRIGEGRKEDRMARGGQRRTEEVRGG